jgi:hypothetical protein
MISLYELDAFKYVEKHPSPHQLILAVRGYEGDGVLGLELAQLYALVELAVVDGDGALRPTGLVARFA